MSHCEDEKTIATTPGPQNHLEPGRRVCTMPKRPESLPTTTNRKSLLQERHFDFILQDPFPDPPTQFEQRIGRPERILGSF